MSEPVRLLPPSAPAATASAEPNTIALEPLAVSGLVVEKAALIQALRVYVPRAKTSTCSKMAIAFC